MGFRQHENIGIAGDTGLILRYACGRERSLDIHLLFSADAAISHLCELYPENFELMLSQTVVARTCRLADSGLASGDIGKHMVKFRTQRDCCQWPGQMAFLTTLRRCLHWARRNSRAARALPAPNDLRSNSPECIHVAFVAMTLARFMLCHC